MSFRATRIEAVIESFNYRTILICLLGLIGAGLLPTLIMRAIGWDNGFWLIGNIWRGEGGRTETRTHQNVATSHACVSCLVALACRL